MVAGCAPGVRTIASSVLFHSITGFTACENSELSVSPPNATPGIPAVCAQTAGITSATILKQFRIEVLLSLLLSRKHQAKENFNAKLFQDGRTGDYDTLRANGRDAWCCIWRGNRELRILASGESCY